MDVAVGATDVPVRCFLRVAFGLVPFIYASNGWTMDEKSPIHFSGDKQFWDRKTSVVELIGNASVTQSGETLTAKRIKLNLKTKVLDASGDCIYATVEEVISGNQMHFNLDTRTGTVIDGRVTDDRFILTGERINKLAEGRFQTHWGTYTTCRDCSESWSLSAEDVDMQVDGYAFMSNVITKVKDAPAFWLPYLIVPTKTRRQTGFLIPTFGHSGPNGLMFSLPFFWAINRSSDMTLTLGDYTAKGIRGELEGRYVVSNRSSGQANFFYINDASPDFLKFDAGKDRWGLNIRQSQELPWGIEEKLKITTVRDNLFPFTFVDVPGGGEAFLPSVLTFSHSSPEASGILSFQYYKNILYRHPDPKVQVVGDDPRTVQVLPSLTVTTRDRALWNSPVSTGFTVGVSNFTRTAGDFDFDLDHVKFGTNSASASYLEGIDPLRKAVRVYYNPSVYTVIRPFEEFSIVPSVQYRGFFYNFGGNNNVPTLSRGYVLFQADFVSQLERIFEFPDTPGAPRGKHLIRPILTYSNIPIQVENQNHPFVRQISNKNRMGYNFDVWDIVPYNYNASTSPNFFTPLGNSLAYGFRTQWVRRYGGVDSPEPYYLTPIDWSAGNILNLQEVFSPIDPANPQPFSRFFSNLGLGIGSFGSSVTYYFDPYVPAPKSTWITSMNYIFERAVRKRILLYDRSVSLSYSYTGSNIGRLTSSMTGTLNFSISDYFLPYGSISYDFVASRSLGTGGGIILQSPSQCWKLVTGLTYTPGQNIAFSFDLSLNLTGNGFTGMSDVAAQAASR